MYTEGKYSDTSYLSGNVFFWLPIWIGQVASLSLFVFFILYVPINHQSSIMYNLFCYGRLRLIIRQSMDVYSFSFMVLVFSIYYIMLN